MRPPLAADAGLGLIKIKEIIKEITRKEKKLFLLNQLKLENLNTYFYWNELTVGTSTNDCHNF